MPLADAAVRIAEALGVSVEYLVTGRDQNAPALEPDSRLALRSLESLSLRDRKVVLSVIKALKDLRDSERKGHEAALSELG